MRRGWIVALMSLVLTAVVVAVLVVRPGRQPSPPPQSAVHSASPAAVGIPASAGMSPSPSPSPSVTGRPVVVRTLAALQAALDQANPGDRVELAAGVYIAHGTIAVTRAGTPGKPIVIAAQTVGAVEITGPGGFTLGPVSYVEVSGFRLTTTKPFVVPTQAHHIRFSRNSVQLATDDSWVQVSGDDGEIDHNTFENRSSQGVFLQVSGPGLKMAQRTWIHHNYFHNHSFSGANGGESIRLGYGNRWNASAKALVEFNLFEKADGDPEAISVKSSDNIIRFNTLRDSKGWIVLRAGDRNRVEGNFLLGSGIRYYNNDHVIVSNIIMGSRVVAGSGTSADTTDTDPAIHARPDRVRFAFNTIVGSGTLIEVGPGADPLGPDNCLWANNILPCTGQSALVRGTRASNSRWEGNIIWPGSAGDLPVGGYRLVDPGLVSGADGVPRIAALSSAATDSAVDGFRRPPLTSMEANALAAKTPVRKSSRWVARIGVRSLQLMSGHCLPSCETRRPDRPRRAPEARPPPSPGFHRPFSGQRSC